MCTESQPAVYKPLSLQHWALLSAVKGAVADSTPRHYGGFVMFDIPQFKTFKLLHQRGVRVLDYEFSLDAYDIYRMRVPLRTLIYQWERRNHCTIRDFFQPLRYCGRLVDNLNSLRPFCGCMINPEESVNIPTERNTDRVNAHAPDCRRQSYPCCDCRMDILQNINTPESKNNVFRNGHTTQCRRQEFRYQVL